MMAPSPGLLVLCCVLLVALWWLFRPSDPDAPKLLFVTMLVGLFGVTASVLLSFASAAFPLKFDAYLYSTDTAVLGSPLFPAAHLLNKRSYMVLRPIYDLLPVVMILCYAINLKWHNGRVVLTAFAVNFLLGSALYLIVPACGPAFAFDHDFPFGRPSSSVQLLRVSDSPNAIPSLHLSAAILLVLFAGNRLSLRIFAWLYLLGTAAATLALGEHYVIDLIVAVPFAAFAVLIARGRILAACGNMALVVAWLVSIRFATSSLIAYPNLMRASVMGTICLAVYSLASRTQFASQPVQSHPPVSETRDKRLDGSRGIAGTRAVPAYARAERGLPRGDDA